MVTAYHEAGHILLAEWYGAKVIFASTLPDNHHGTRSHGMTQAIWPPARDDRERAVQLAKVALAGPAAESIYQGEQYEPEIPRESWTDRLAAAEAIQRMAPMPLSTEQQELVLSRILDEVIRFLSRDSIWDRVAGIASELDAHETLDEFQIDELREKGRLF